MTQRRQALYLEPDIGTERLPSMTFDAILGTRLGFGAAPLGNMFRDIREDEAQATVDAAWNDGIRDFDTAQFYGAGLAEIRLGDALASRPRGEYVIISKVGRIILDEVEDVAARDLGEKGDVLSHERPNRIVNDYSEDATLRPLARLVDAAASLPGGA